MAETLTKMKKLENTLIVFLSDNTMLIFVADPGDFTGKNGLLKKGVEVPVCLSRIPIIWHGPGILQNKASHDPHLSNVDIMPPIFDIIRSPIPVGVQERRLWPMLLGKDYPKEEFLSIFVQQGFGDCIPRF